jgi:hypothetical protein
VHTPTQRPVVEQIHLHTAALARTHASASHARTHASAFTTHASAFTFDSMEGYFVFCIQIDISCKSDFADRLGRPRVSLRLCAPQRDCAVLSNFVKQGHTQRRPLSRT